MLFSWLMTYWSMALLISDGVGRVLRVVHGRLFGLEELVAAQAVVALANAIVADIDRHHAFFLGQALEKRADGVLVFATERAA